MSGWAVHLEREVERYRDGERRLPGTVDPDARQRQLTRMGNAAGGAGLALLMAGRKEEAALWLGRAAERYRESMDGAPAGSWGRPIGALKALLLARDRQGAAAEAAFTLDLGAAGTVSPIGRYAGCLALLVLGRDGEAVAVAGTLQGRKDFPEDVADGLAALGRGDSAAYAEAAARVLESFERRESYLEDMPVADTVAVLQELAGPRGLAADLESPLLPPAP